MSKIIRFIGDIHGDVVQWKNICETTENPTVQVGDFGFGFFNVIPSFNKKDRFIRGNHDDPSLCRKHPQWISDGTIEGDMMFIGGAWSIDQLYRIPGISWWSDEQLSYSEFDAVIKDYEKAKPRILVTHDCPQHVVSELFSNAIPYPTITGSALDAMYEIHEPKIHIFGHWHKDRDVKINNTRFICLGEMSYIDLKID